MAKKRHLPDAISSDYAEQFRGQYSDLLDHEITRKKINSVIDDYISKVAFMEKVRTYASMEIDNRLFRSWQYWGTTIATAIVTSIIGFLIGNIF